MIEQAGPTLNAAHSPWKTQYLSNGYEYRQESARLERRKTSSTVWFEVTGEDMLRMTPDELRTVANAIERVSGNA